MATRFVGAPAMEELDREGRGAAVVGDLDRDVVALVQELAQGQVLPVEVDGPADGAGARIDDAGRPDADAEERRPAARGQLVDDLVDDRQGLLAVEAGDVALGRRLDAAPKVHDGAAEAELAEIEADDLPGVIDELEEDRGLAARRRPAPDLAGEAVGHQLADHVADGRPGQGA